MSEEKELPEKPNSDKRNAKEESRKKFPIHEYRLIPAEEVWENDSYESDEIDIFGFLNHIWQNRKTIYKFLTVGIVIGLAIALLTPKEYVSGATLMPEMPSTQSGASSLLQQYGGLLGMSGSTDLGQDGIIPPQLYPVIVQSLPFQLALLNEEVRFNRFDTTTTVFNFFHKVQKPTFISYIKGYTIGLPGKVIGLFGQEDTTRALPTGFEPDSIISVTSTQMEIIEGMRNRVDIALNEETGVINLTVRMPDPNSAAQLAKTSIEQIKEYVTLYRTRKAQENLTFSQEQLEVAEERFRAAQDRLAEFRDANINLSTARAQTQQQRLQSEYDLTFNVYSSMAQQVEQAKLKVQEQTPVVSVLQPVQVPVDDETSGFRVLITYTVLSAFLGFVWIFLRKIIESNLFEKMTDNE